MTSIIGTLWIGTVPHENLEEGLQGIISSVPNKPDKEIFYDLIEDILEDNWLTNDGPLVQGLEKELGDRLGLEHVSLLSSGTSGLVAAILALDISREQEVVTTPFSFAATATAPLALGYRVRMVDIEEDTLGIDPEKLRANISSPTGLVMPVHCFGHPCKWKQINQIATERGIPTIYDAAHCFGIGGGYTELLADAGIYSVVSLHATKVFNTVEGGLVISKTRELKDRIDTIRNFGLIGSKPAGIGLNMKMSELHAAYGLAQLHGLNKSNDNRVCVRKVYDDELIGCNGLQVIGSKDFAEHNMAYYPCLVNIDGPDMAGSLLEYLAERKIFARRYFHPLLSNSVKSEYLLNSNEVFPVARSISDRIICLPIHSCMTRDDALRVAGEIKNFMKQCGEFWSEKAVR